MLACHPFKPNPNTLSEPTMPSATREQLRTLTRSIYDVQHLRVQIGNRITQIFKTRMGQVASETEATLEPEDQNVLKELRDEWKRITDGIVAKKIEYTETITSDTEYRLIQQYMELSAFESRSFKSLEKTLEDFPIYNEWLSTVRGIGPAMAAVLISEIDISKCKYASSLWKYVGLDVAPDGRGRGRYKEHLVERTYKDKEGVEKTKMGLTFSPWIKSKLIGVIGSGFIKLGGPYRILYDQYKHRITTDKSRVALHAQQKGRLGHINAMATRYAVKMFLSDLYKNWRRIDGHEVHNSYHEGVQGHYHNSAS